MTFNILEVLETNKTFRHNLIALDTNTIAQKLSLDYDTASDVKRAALAIILQNGE